MVRMSSVVVYYNLIYMSRSSAADLVAQMDRRINVSFLIFVACIHLLVLQVSHGQWTLDTTPLWADFGHNGVPGNPCPGTKCVLTDSQASFIANTYKFVSLEKCFGMKWGEPGNKTEANFIEATAQLKKSNPVVKVTSGRESGWVGG